MRPGVALLLGAGALAACGDAPRPQVVRDAGAQQPRREVTAAINASRRTALVDATQRVAPAVVSVSVTSRQTGPASMWDFFFVPQEAERVRRGYGTGFVVRPNGVIITNQHVVAGATDISVTLPDGTDRPARLLGEDPTTDIAVLRIEGSNLPTVPIGRSTDLMIGEWVVAMGNPYAFLLGNAEPTVTVGVVSATGRNILPSGEQPGLYLDMIQTDAAINPGNSGGPLANAQGEVVGVNSSIFSNTGGSVGLGFAIPIERAMRIADEILARGSVRRAWVGLDVAGPGSMGEWKQEGGVLVAGVAPGGPAARAGIRPQDVLLTANGRRLRNFLDWEAAKLDLHVGDELRVTVRQRGRDAERRIVTGDLPTVTAEKVTVLRNMQLITVTPAVRSEKGLQSAEGALVARIPADIAAGTGLQADDVIVGINRTRIRSAEQVQAILESQRAREVLRVYFERNRQYSFVDLVFK